MQMAKSVGAQHRVGDIFFRQSCEGVRRRNLHFLVDGAGSNIQGATEYKRETKNIVDLVGIVGTPGRNDEVRPRRLRSVIADFRRGVGHRKYDGPVSHQRTISSVTQLGPESPAKTSASFKAYCQGSRGGFGGEAGLVGVHVLDASFVDDPLGVAKD